MHIGPFEYYGGMSQSRIDNQVRKDLIRKRDKYLSLIETILEELKIEKFSESKGKIDEIMREKKEKKCRRKAYKNIEKISSVCETVKATSR